MTTATCKCPRGHVFTTELICYEPSRNYSETAAAECPDCGAEEFEIVDIDYDSLDD